MSDTESGGGSVPISLEWQDFRFLNTVDNMSWNLKKRKKQERNLLMIQDSCRAGRDNHSQRSRNRPNTKWDVSSVGRGQIEIFACYGRARERAEEIDFSRSI